MCALEVYNEEKFVRWAHNWLDGTNRTAEAAAKNINYDGEEIQQKGYFIYRIN